MRIRFPWLPFFISATLLVLSSCDSSEADTSCEALGLPATGSFTATIDGDAYRADCFQVNLNDGVLSVTGFRTSLAEYVSVAVEDADPGMYVLDTSDRLAFVDYARPSGGARYTVGTLTIELFSESRIRGTFDVSTEDGGRDASGAFDIRY